MRAYRRWIEAAGITEGPVFRGFRNQKIDAHAITPQVVGLVIKKAARRAGLDASELAGHSLRSGLATRALTVKVVLLASDGRPKAAGADDWLRDLFQPFELVLRLNRLLSNKLLKPRLES